MKGNFIIRMKILNLIRDFVNKKNINYILVFIFFIILFSLIYFTVPSIISFDDPMFHIKYSQLIREKGYDVIENFQWIYYSIQARSGLRYSVSLFHFILIPFTYFNELWMGIKVFGVFGASIIMLSLYWWIKKLNFKYPFIILLFFWSVFPEWFAWRIFLARPLVLMILLVLFEIYFIWQKKYWIVFFLVILHIFNHNYTFYLPIFFIIIFIIFEYLHRKKFDFKLLISGFLGTIFGMMTMPDFPKNIINQVKILVAIYQSVWQKSDIFIPEGGELYGRNIFDFIYNNYLFIGIILFFIILRIVYYYLQKRNKNSVIEDRLGFFQSDKKYLIIADALFFINLVCLVGFILSGRVLDFWIPLSLIYVLLMIKIVGPKLNLKIEDNYRKILNSAFKIFIVVILAYLLTTRAFSLNKSIARNYSPTAFRGVAEWLLNNTNEGDIIFLDNWSNFTQLFHYDTKNYYIMGLEPRFLYEYNKELYLYWYNISYKGLPCNNVDCQEWIDKINDKVGKEAIKLIDKDIADIIYKKFNSKYISTTSNSGNFYSILKNSDYFSEVYVDSNYNNLRLFEINVEKLNENN